MNPTSERPDNPFSSRFIDPDRHPFLFPAGESLVGLTERLAANDWWGEIVGPHGSGKSTLLHTLLDWAAETGRPTRFIFLNDRLRQLPPDWARGARPTCYAVDGAEQLSRWAWWRLKRHCRRRGCGLVVTSHRSLGLPLLYRSRPLDGRAVQQVVGSIAGPESTPEPALAARLAEVHRGNMRLILFELYDRWAGR